MTMDCSACDFDVTDITAYDSDGNELTDSNLAAESLAVYDLVHGGDYTFVIEGPPDVSDGKFDCKIECTSDAPTKAPTDEPTESPTPEPTDAPTGSPTKAPTNWPTVSPTPEPTGSPTNAPTSEPTDSPTTPAPTHPGELTCGVTDTGDYNGEPMEIEVRMPYDGDMTINCGGSDFEIGSITVYDSDGNALTDADAAASILTVHDLGHGGDYLFIVEGADGVSSGTYECTIYCSSDAPTKSPTTEPTTEPTLGPTTEPTSEPTTDPTIVPTLYPTTYPTVEPTDDPTSDPTVDPTEQPSTSPTTPAPTHPGELTCGDNDTGDYNGEPMEIEVRMPYDGDLTIVCSASDFEIGSITAYDSSGNELTDADAA